MLAEVSNPEVIVQITAPHFCAGLIAFEGGTCFEAAPIIRYMIGWNGQQVQDYCIKKGWTWQARRQTSKRSTS
jgi:hypothetical protein